MSFCPKCGEKIHHGEHTKFNVCPQCGASIASGYSWHQKERRVPNRSTSICIIGVVGAFIIGAILIGSIILSTDIFTKKTSDLNPIADTYVDSQNPSSNYGGDSFLSVSNSKYHKRTTILKFDLAQISGIDKISFKMRSYIISETHLITIYLCENIDWNELGLNYESSQLIEISLLLGTLQVAENNKDYEWRFTATGFEELSECTLLITSDYHENGYLFFHSKESNFQSYRPILSIIHSV